MNRKKTEPNLTDFQKFRMYQQKSKDLDRLNTLYFKLRYYAEVDQAAIRKAMRISVKRWVNYLCAAEPIPYGFLEKFENIFKTELIGCQRKIDKARADEYFNLRNIAGAEANDKQTAATSPSNFPQ